jgi:hypothetical protein
MSRNYEVVINLTDVPAQFYDVVIESFHDCGFDVSELQRPDGSWEATLEGNLTLSGGESVEQFVERRQRGVWEAAECYLDVSITVYYIEQTPTETFDSNEEDYQKWLEASTST